MECAVLTPSDIVKVKTNKSPVLLSEPKLIVNKSAAVKLASEAYPDREADRVQDNLEELEV